MSTAALKHHRTAPDVLKNEQKWSDKLVSMAGMWNSKYISPWRKKDSPGHLNGNGSASPVVLYPHVFKLHISDGKTWVFIASCETYSIWVCYNSPKTGAFHTELVVTGNDSRIIDGCIWTYADGDTSCYTVTDMSDGGAKSFLVKKRAVLTGPRTEQDVLATSSAQFSGEIVSMTTVNNYVVLCQVGVLKLLCRESLHVFVDIPSIMGAPTVFAASDRWFAVQIAQSHSRGSNTDSSSHTSEADFNVAARKLVSGAYTLGKAGWERIGPMVYQMYKKEGDSAGTHTVDPAAASIAAAAPTFQGGAVAVFDAVTIRTEEDLGSGKDDKLSISLNSVCKFLAHNEDLELLSFSPSGIMVASAARSGQVIHVHALASSGLLFSSSAKTISIKNRKDPYEQTPQLVYKLVRGYSLATVIHISFDSVESMTVVGTNNGTVHVFDLERHNTSSGLGHMGRELSPISTTDINMNGKNSAGSASGVSFTGSEISSSAGSAPSSAPLSNMDEMLSQFTSQQALDAKESTKENLKYLRSLIKEIYSSDKMRLPTRDFVAFPDGVDAVEEVVSRISAPAGISYVKAGSVASTVGFSSLAVEINVVNSDRDGSSRFVKGSMDTHELCILSSQGFLSRFRVPNKGISNQNGHTRFSTGSLIIPQLAGGINGLLNGSGNNVNQPRELNRWDLFASLEECDALGNSSEHVDTESKSKKSTPGPASGSSINGGCMSWNSNAAAWLYALGDVRGAAGSGKNPLWARPQVAYKSRLRQSSSTEKEKLPKKQPHAASAAFASPYVFLFPERTASEALGGSQQNFVGEPGLISISATILTALDISPTDGDAHRSGRLVASKHVETYKTERNIDLMPAFEDWEVPSEKDWELDEQSTSSPEVSEEL